MSSPKKLSQHTQEHKAAEKKKNITNTKQFERLVVIMKKNGDLAKGLLTSKADYIEAWQNVAIQLNSIGPPVRNEAGWKKVWSDLKAKIKKKLEHNKKCGTHDLYIFSQLEESVLNLLIMEKTPLLLNSVGLVQNTQLPSTSNCQQQSSINSSSIHESIPDIKLTLQGSTQAEEIGNNVDNPPICPTSDQQECKPSITWNYQEEKRQLLENQTRNIEEQTKHIKECALYSRKLYELNEKKFKLWCQIQNEKKQYRKLSMEYKLKELKYKERKLALLERNNH